MEVDTFAPDNEWFRSVAPDGLPVDASTVISGPGGSGKPLIGFAVVEAWLDAGGSVVFLLTNSDDEFVFETMDLLYDVDRKRIEEGVVFVDFDPEMEASLDALETDLDDQIAGNLLDPDVWNGSIEAALERVPETERGTLLFGSALNLFLFSPTYREAILETLVETVERTDLTTLLTVSTSAYAEDIGRVEAAADTVLMTEMVDGGLTLRGEHSESVTLTDETVEVPFSAEELDHIQSVAEESRDNLIPTIKSI